MGRQGGPWPWPPPEANHPRECPVRQPPGIVQVTRPLKAPTMSVFNFASSLKRVLPRRPPRGGRRGSRRRASLRLEHLEDRLAPAATILSTNVPYATIQAAAGTNVSATEGSAFTGVVATFTVQNGSTAA